MSIARTVRGHTFDLENSEMVAYALATDGILVIPSCSKLPIRPNSINMFQSAQNPDLDITTFEFIKRDVFLPYVVGKAIFALNDSYYIGSGTVMIPLGEGLPRELQQNLAFTATLFGDTQWDSFILFRVDIQSPTGSAYRLNVNGGDIIICTDKVKKAKPIVLAAPSAQVLRENWNPPAPTPSLLPQYPTTFVYETRYWPREGELISRSLIDAYMGESNGELVLEGGKLIWKKQNFVNRMAE